MADKTSIDWHVLIPRNAPTHWQTLRLARALGLSPAIALGHIVSLRCWAADNVPNSGIADAEKIDDELVAQMAGWGGDATHFMEALESADFIDRPTDGTRFFWFDGKPE